MGCGTYDSLKFMSKELITKRSVVLDLTHASISLSCVSLDSSDSMLIAQITVLMLADSNAADVESTSW